ncbi:MAG: Wzz/FepE/Etk N-terminal domain-containing protein [Eubacteriales bacterium]|jgi:capsular polysaccharide biosynthesis protein|nr:Wzz/FepE/Etk N-terminal domain-containing protein [Bacillota bacterium]
MEELDLRDIIDIITKRIWIIAAITIFALLMGIIFSVFILDDIYASSTTLIVRENRKDGGSVQLSDINLARNLVDTYSVIIKSDRVLEKVVTELRSDLSLGQLRNKISVRAEGNTEIIRISVEDINPETARDIANSVARVFINEIQELMDMDNVQIIDEAREQSSPVKPNVKLNIAISLILGLMLGIGLAFIIELLDKTIKEPDFIEKQLGLPVLGVIPEIE